ncbi:hypothetical protein SAMN06297129_2977 [Pseudooceanicola antarcticus]|uniref:Uncharacterized protein n=1 Tax=Pseudooceanicola antarcticus TaxID=1247613 RepID=A0A285J875_9RHOB|nr:hypothetical protein [Pseudooceanicola antarcticus]PJE26807.1 hypothetical protein CVM39_15835 [Pseudooceanicola antarcticus]SNY55321.1 hypothetical protein SAMN06297129_2977 [Pseudooceanicola antarcticus]
MPVPDFTPYAGLLPSETDPATFPARAEALMAWFTQTGAPQLAALVTFLNGLLEDEATVLDALDALEDSLGGLAFRDVLNELDFASDSEERPPSQKSVGAFARSVAVPQAQFSYTEPAGVTGNAWNTSAFTKLDINTEDKNDLDITLSANTLTFGAAGTYWVEAWSNVRNNSTGSRHFACRLQNATAMTTAVIGAGTAATANGPSANMHVSGQFTVAEGDVIELQGYASGSIVAPNPANLGQTELYSVVKFWRVS